MYQVKRYSCMITSLILLKVAIISLVIVFAPAVEVFFLDMSKENLSSFDDIFEYRKDVIYGIWTNPKLYISYLIAFVGFFFMWLTSKISEDDY